MPLDKPGLASGIEKAYNSVLPGGDDFNKDADIKKKNKKFKVMLNFSTEDALRSFINRFK